jgi:glycosyltransferase involved in cell wall biosynthesis
MRVFIVIATFHPLVGGAEKQAFQQCWNLRQRGLEATIVTFRHDKSWAAYDIIDGVPVIRIAGLLLGRREGLPRILQKVLYFIALIAMGWILWHYRQRYDVLHVYQLNLLALPTAFACCLGAKPMVVAVRCADSGRKEPSQHQVSLMAGPLDTHDPMLDVYGETRAVGDLEDLGRLGKPVMRFTRSLLQRIHAVVIILSTRMQEYLVSHDFTFPNTGREVGAAAYPCPQPLLIPNGVDTSRFHPPTEDASHSQTVVCTARLCYQKGHDVLLQAWHLVHKELPDARLIIAGIGPLQAQLAYMAETLDLGQSVDFVGLQSDVVAVLHRGSIATLPSRWEGMPNAILEAMACGLPCVATRVSGTEDIITHEVNGLLVEPEDSQALAQALLALLRDPPRSSAYGKAARERIEQNYAVEHITDIYVELYERMVSARSSHGRCHPKATLRIGTCRDAEGGTPRPYGSDSALTTEMVISEGTSRCAE